MLKVDMIDQNCQVRDKLPHPGISFSNSNIDALDNHRMHYSLDRQTEYHHSTVP